MAAIDCYVILGFCAGGQFSPSIIIGYNRGIYQVVVHEDINSTAYNISWPYDRAKAGLVIIVGVPITLGICTHKNPRVSVY